jgi:phosphatidylglycerol:prolipoprotein diacylglycerol transferase
MLPTLQIGPFSLPVPALIVIIGVWLGISLAERHAARYGVRAGLFFNLVLISFLVGIIGSRLTYMFHYPKAFIESPLDLFSRNPGLLDPLGGIVTGIIAGAIYGQRRGMQLLPTLDALTPMLGVIAVAINLSNLASGKAYGIPTNLPWGIELWGAQRHPTQFYGTIWASIILILIWSGKGIIKSSLPGITFLSFMGLTAFSRLILEALRGDSSVFVYGLRSAQVLAWLALGASLWGIWKLKYTGEDRTSSTGDRQSEKHELEDDKIN